MVPRQKLHVRGPEVSRLAWGAWRALKGEETKTPPGLARFIDRCVEIGITTIDLADIYGGFAVEGHLGAALRESASGRDAIEIVTKFGIRPVGPARPHNREKHYDAGRTHIFASVENSLKEIGTDRLDLLLLHRPDFLAPAEETARALEDLVASGKVLAVGVSNHAPAQVSLLQSRMTVPIVTNQVEMSLMRLDALDDGTLAQAQQDDAAPMIWSPLGGGRLANPEDATARPVREALAKAGARYGIDDIAAVAIAWLLRLPSRPVPIIGSTRFDRVQSIARACTMALEAQDWYRILAAARGPLA
ncbi:MAG: oxidoreductase [Alphaproteobacteria bacterium]|nr:oxidoreductase [Alphaproteobacteria bacterium]